MLCQSLTGRVSRLYLIRQAKRQDPCCCSLDFTAKPHGDVVTVFAVRSFLCSQCRATAAGWHIALHRTWFGINRHSSTGHAAAGQHGQLHQAISRGSPRLGRDWPRCRASTAASRTATTATRTPGTAAAAGGNAVVFFNQASTAAAAATASPSGTAVHGRCCAGDRSFHNQCSSSNRCEAAPLTLRHRFDGQPQSILLTHSRCWVWWRWGEQIAGHDNARACPSAVWRCWAGWHNMCSPGGAAAGAAASSEGQGSCCCLRPGNW